METVTSRPPRLGMLLTKTPCPIHRLGATTKELGAGDYELVNGNFVRHYIYDDINAIGASCFTPLGDPPHKNPISDPIDCYFISRISYCFHPQDEASISFILSKGMALLYSTNEANDISRVWRCNKKS
jgi:hypothetical protein